MGTGCFELELGPGDYFRHSGKQRVEGAPVRVGSGELDKIFCYAILGKKNEGGFPQNSTDFSSAIGSDRSVDA